MTDTHATIVCEHCQARLRVKPGLLKVLKTIKCSKCGHAIPVTQAVPPAAEEPVEAAHAAPEPVVTAVGVPAVPSPEAAPPPPPPPEPAPVPNHREEMEALQIKLRAAEREIAELDDRVASLQELWQSKEIEVREMAARARKAEDQAREALAIRDAFIARARQELFAFLVGERDATLSRFTDLEQRLMAIVPESGARQP